MGGNPIFFSLIVVLVLCSARSTRSELIDENAPAFYCFVDPPVKTHMPADLLDNVTSCSHLVYGRVSIDTDTGYPDYSVSDVSSGLEFDNLRRFRRWRSKHPNAKFLLGVVRTRPFDDQLAAEKVARGLVRELNNKRLDGVFVQFEGIHLEYRSSTAFIEALKKASEKRKTSITLAVTARRVFAFDAIRRLAEINPLVEHIYLDMGELPSNENPRQITHIDPLFSNTSIPFEETIQGTVEELSKEGILAGRLVIGLTAGGWRFETKASADPLRTSHGQYAARDGQRVAYQEACRARGAVVYEWSVMNEVTVWRNTWTTVNLPTENAMGEKIKWIIAEKFAGLGIRSAESDDPSGECGTDGLPAHRLAEQLLRTTIAPRAAKCTRLCYLDPREPDVATLPIDNLRADYCSHIVVEYFELDLKENVVVADGARQLVEKIDEWRERILHVAPKLLLSIGSKQSTSVWQFVLGNDFRRKEVAEEVARAVNESTADGVEVSWTLEPLRSEFDKNNLKAFVDDVVAAAADATMHVVVATTAHTAFADFYDYAHLNKTASLIVLHTHRLHSDTQPVTGHPSPLATTRSMKGSRMSWTDVLEHWLAKKVLAEKLVLSLSASAVSMQSLGSRARGATDPFGLPALVSTLRSRKNDLISGQEICESLESGSATWHWAPGAEVPYAERFDQLVAYEDARSAHVKAVWSSTRGVAGLAVHHVQHDDPQAVCDNRTAFPILAALARAQTCERCVTRHDFKKCPRQHEFTVACHFELRKSTPVFKTEIVPYERCTQVVVEHAKLTLGGNVSFHSSHEEHTVANLTEMRHKMQKCGMILSVSCGNSEMHLNYILGDNMTSSIDNVMEIMEKYKFSGVQLDCEKAIRRGNHVFFNRFIRKLLEKFEKTKASNGCEKTLSARFSYFTRAPSELYSASLLNRLSHISLRMSDSSSRVDLPFFANSSSSSGVPSSERFVDVWTRFGLKREKLVLEVSPFGWTDGEKRVGRGLGDTCVAVGNRAPKSPHYETLTSRVTHGNVTIHVPTEHDLRYKISWALREKLAGIGLNSLNGDDYTGICGRGSFPFLKSVYSRQNCRLN